MKLDEVAMRALDHCRGRHDAMLQLIEALVSSPSHSDDLAGVALCFDVLDAALRALGFEVARPEAPEGRPHLLATRPGADPKDPTVLCLGHVDTIYDESFPGGSFGVHGNRIHGPGVADMKAGLVVMLTALEALEKTDFIDQFRIRVLVTSDKEHGALASRDLIRRIASEADVALVFGPTEEEGGVVRSRSGTGRFQIRMQGRGDTAQEQGRDGRNVIVELAHMIPELESLNDAHRGVMLNCGIVQGGARSATLPATATLDIEVWCDGPTDQRWILTRLHTLAQRASRGAIETTVTGGFTRPPWPPSARTDNLVEMWSHASTLLGYQALEGQHSTRASDANLTHDAAVPTLDGLGARGGGLHSDEEWIVNDELALRAAIAASGLLAWLEERSGQASWRVRGIIQGETPTDGEVEISPEEQADEVPTVEQEGGEATPESEPPAQLEEAPSAQLEGELPAQLEEVAEEPETLAAPQDAAAEQLADVAEEPEAIAEPADDDTVAEAPAEEASVEEAAEDAAAATEVIEAGEPEAAATETPPQEWYFEKDGKQNGPVEEAQIRGMLADGTLSPDNKVWSNELPGWTPARDVFGIEGQLLAGDGALEIDADGEFGSGGQSEDG